MVQEKENAVADLQKELTELRLHNLSYVFNGLPYFVVFLFDFFTNDCELSHRCMEECSQSKVDLEEKIKFLEVVVNENFEHKAQWSR